jgi:hypothetical protein
MPRLFLIRNPNPGRIQFFYSVDQAVGTGCPNVRPDVKLVQFFLRILVDEDKSFTGSVPATVKRPLNIDGSWGSQSAAYLEAWENVISQQQQIRRDRRVDPISTGTTVSAISHTSYKICVMNGAYGKFRGAVAHAKIFNDPLFPQELTPTLFVTVPAAAT